MKVGFNMLLWTTHVAEEHLPLLETLKKVGYDGIEVPLFEGDIAHFEKVGKAIKDNGLGCTTVTVIPDEEHNPISSDSQNRLTGVDYLKWAIDWSPAVGSTMLCWPFYQPLGIFTGQGSTEDEKQRAARKVIDAFKAAKNLKVKVVNGFTGSLIWHMLYSFPPVFLPAKNDFDIPLTYRKFTRCPKWRQIPAEVPEMVNTALPYKDYRQDSHSEGKCVEKFPIGASTDYGRQPLVMVIYSHEDEYWEKRFVKHLYVLQEQGILRVWDDSQIDAGQNWEPAIDATIDTCCVAIFMVTKAFLTSKFILRHEVPLLMERMQAGKIRIIPVLVEPCPWHEVKWLSSMEMRPGNGRAISSGSDDRINADFSAIAEEVASIIRETRETSTNKKYCVRLDIEIPNNNPEVFSTLSGLLRNFDEHYIHRGGSGLAIKIVVSVGS